MKPSRIRLGIDRFIADPALSKGLRRIGLITNDAARVSASSAKTNRRALLDAGLPLVRLFSPEHGLMATAPDGAAVPDSTDPLTGLPSASLYGSHLTPDPATVADLDAVLFDLQDIGIRFYTFIWTLFHAMEVCREVSCPILVLDRPNPLGGSPANAEGPILDHKRLGSFLGLAPIPVRHGLTAGELARHWQREYFPGLDLRVIAMEGWTGRPAWPSIGLPWHPPSPAIPSFESALFYGATALFEATNLSVARNSNLSFQALGAPWLRGEDLADRINEKNLPGVRAESISFRPAGSPYAGDLCTGIRLLATTREDVRPVAAGLHLLASIIALHRDSFRWCPYPTTANPSGLKHFEKLVGTAGLREKLDADAPGISTAQIDRWTSAGDWTSRTADSLLYTE